MRLMNAGRVIVALVFVSVCSLVFANSQGTDGKSPQEPAAARVSAARQISEWTLKDYEEREGSIEESYLWSERLAASERATNQSEARGSFERHLSRMKHLEEVVKARAERGRTSQHEVSRATFYRADAECQLQEMSAQKR